MYNQNGFLNFKIHLLKYSFIFSFSLIELISSLKLCQINPENFEQIPSSMSNSLKLSLHIVSQL